MSDIFRVTTIAVLTTSLFSYTHASAQADTAQATSPVPPRSTPIASDLGGDIIVTAQRREERNQDVPIAITAFSADGLRQQNIQTGQDLNGKVPSLTVTPGGQATRDVEGFILRGVAPSVQVSPSVVTYLSEVPLPQGFSTSQQGGPGNFIDLENAQVLSGPQGTLFGRNTMGGAVLLVPRKPTNDFAGYLQASAGNYDYRGLEGVANIPVVEDKLLIRASGTFQDRTGFTKDVVWNTDRDNMHYYAGRVGIMMRPTEGVENYLLVFGAKSSTHGTGHIHKAFNIPGLIAIGACREGPSTSSVASCDVYRNETALADQLGPRRTRNSLNSFEDTETWGIINTSNVDLSSELTLRNIVSFQRYKKDFVYDGDGTPFQTIDVGPGPLPDFPVPGLTDTFGIPANGYQNERTGGPRDNLKQFTEELQLQGNLLENRLNFAAGAFYYKQTPIGLSLNRGFTGCAAALTGLCLTRDRFYRVSSEAKALFGQATLDLGILSPRLESLRVTAGYRYSWDKVSGLSRSVQNLAAPGMVRCTATGVTTDDPTNCDYTAKLKSKSPTWTFGVDYKPSTRLLLFAKVSRGYKAGGFNPSAVRPEAQTIDPERVTTYEAGFKSDFRLGTMPSRLNVTTYLSDYTNIQRQAADSNNGIFGSRSFSASAKIKGVEAEAMIRPLPLLQLSGNVSYTDAKWKEFSFPTLGPTVRCNGAVPAGGIVDASCTPFGVSKWIYSVQASLDIPVAESLGEVNLFANYSHASRREDTAPNLPGVEPGQVYEPFGLLNLSLDWRKVAGSSLDASLFVTNVTNKLYRISNGNLFNAFNVWETVYGEPRMYGVRLRYSFGQN